MWRLEKFDKTTHLLVADYPLHNMSADIVEKILDTTDDEHELPIGIRQHDVPLSKASDFAAYMDEPFTVDENCEYEVGYSSD
ncbi:MAG: hypothetical protein V7694_10910 [Rhodococcus sp. (in: high G+C Gram-positive bacteria)]